MQEPLAYRNGRISPASQTSVPLDDLGLVMGASITEMARTFRHAAFHLERHIDRLFRSLKFAGLEIDLTRQALADLARELINMNSRLVPPSHDLGISMFVTAGNSLTYTGYAGMDAARRPNVYVHTFPLPFELWADKYETGQHLVIPSIRHLPPECLDPKIKSRSRMHWWLADEQARQVDPGASALLLDQHDCLTETATANFFVVERGEVVTPMPRNTLQGISQQVVFELCAQLKIPCGQRDIQPYDAINAEEAFTSSTPYCILPVTRLNGRTIGQGRAGPVYLELLHAWSGLVGVEIAEQMRKGAAERKDEFEARR
jgi:branched-subunit amino acid aminotransferase/4-amino-4-deoxychorismate lyase